MCAWGHDCLPLHLHRPSSRWSSIHPSCCRMSLFDLLADFLGAASRAAGNFRFLRWMTGVVVVVLLVPVVLKRNVWRREKSGRRDLVQLVLFLQVRLHLLFSWNLSLCPPGNERHNHHHQPLMQVINNRGRGGFNQRKKGFLLLVVSKRSSLHDQQPKNW